MTKPKIPSPLTFRDYQKGATETDHTGENPQDGTLVAVLGLAGESGDLATQFKKRLRDGDSYTLYPEQCAEELGDILWYASTLCSKLGLSLEDVAQKNLTKTKARWKAQSTSSGVRPLLDAASPASEQIPRRFTVTFSETQKNGRNRVQLTRDGKPCGASLTDNSYFEDGYRFHDIFHLAYAAVLGWSPVTRKLLGCKRRSDASVDEIEDGGRASVIEEGISALVFQYADKHNNLDGVGRIDSEHLSLIARLVAGLEVAEASLGEWEYAILTGYRVFRLLNRNKGGEVTVDLTARTLTYKSGAGTSNDL
ncbi:MAG: putative pyrophosphatase [Nevskia sp.]|nr:putative pyrophosphatase [Nevskia sp.]